MQRKLSELLSAAKAADADQAAKTGALTTATAAKAQSDAAVIKARHDLASAIKGKGGSFVDTAATPLVLYVANDEGTDYTPRPVAGPDDTVEVPDASPPAAPSATAPAPGGARL